MNDKINLYRRNGKLIYIKMPEFNELAFVRELWGKKENMGEFGDVYSFPKEKWEMFYRKMVSPTDGKNFYCLIYDLNDKPIGEVSFHGYNSATKVARINIKIHYEHRKKGYGEEALRLLLEYYFYEFGGQSIIDSVKSDEGKSLLKKIGFEELNSVRNQRTYKLTKEKFLSRKINSKVTVAILAYNASAIVAAASSAAETLAIYGLIAAETIATGATTLLTTATSALGVVIGFFYIYERVLNSYPLSLKYFIMLGKAFTVSSFP